MHPTAFLFSAVSFSLLRDFMNADFTAIFWEQGKYTQVLNRRRSVVLLQLCFPLGA